MPGELRLNPGSAPTFVRLRPAPSILAVRAQDGDQGGIWGAGSSPAPCPLQGPLGPCPRAQVPGWWPQPERGVPAPWVPVAELPVMLTPRGRFWGAATRVAVPVPKFVPEHQIRAGDSAEATTAGPQRQLLLPKSPGGRPPKSGRGGGRCWGHPALAVGCPQPPWRCRGRGSCGPGACASGCGREKGEAKERSERQRLRSGAAGLRPPPRPSKQIFRCGRRRGGDDTR